MRRQLGEIATFTGDEGRQGLRRPPLAANLAPVLVNAIAPGIIDSGAWDGEGEAKSALFTGAAGQTLVGRHGATDDVVNAAIWLMGSVYVDGQTIHVYGGRR